MSNSPAYGASSRPRRTWLLAAGAAAAALGIVGLFLSFWVTIAGVVWYGALLCVAGIVQFIEAFAARQQGSRLAPALIGIVYAVGGFVAMLNPLGASVALTLALGVALLASGVLKGVWALFDRSRQTRTGLILAAFLSLALGALLIAQWPASGLWAIGLLVSCDLLGHGLALLWAGLSQDA
jgi:uncharacterized membrane protein HdeD (DUF308 family)